MNDRIEIVMDDHIEIGAWASVGDSEGDLGSYLNCGELGFETYAPGDILLGRFTDKGELIRALEGYRESRSNGNRSQAKEPNQGSLAPASSEPAPSKPELSLKEFLQLVVPWDCGGYFSIHWQYPKKDGFPGRSFETIDAALQWVAQLKAGAPANIYFCLSRQKLNRGHRDRKNALALQVLWFDIDVDPKNPKKYGTIPEAIAALFRFCAALGLPRPSFIVVSGGGIHVYWVSDRSLTVDEWQVFANALKTAAKNLNLRIDAGLTGNAACVLRVPDTNNWKYGAPRRVHFIQLYCNGTQHNFAVVFGKLLTKTDVSPGIEIAEAFRQLERKKLGDGIVIDEIPPQPLEPILAECAWLRTAFETGGKDFNEPQWNMTTLAAVFLIDGNNLAHAFGKQHPGYTFESTEKKFAEKQRAHETKGVNWPSCAKIDDAGSEHCKTCRHLAEGGSPLHLALRQEGPRKPADRYTDYGADELPEAPVGLNSINAGRDDWNVDPRGWLLGNIFCREFVSSLLGDGGVGKTALRYVQYLALATGKPLIGEHVFIRSRVLLISLEDGLKELRRRIKAACLYHHIDQRELDGWLYYAALGAQDGKLMSLDNYGRPVPGALAANLEHEIIKTRADLVTLDPFVKTHGVDENNNSAIDEVVQILTNIACKRCVAVDIPHHMTKGPADPGNANRGRGASAMKDAARLVYTLTAMTDDDAKILGVAEAERRFLVRMDGGKVNIAPPTIEATWFRLVGVPLGNQNKTYVNGDKVQTVERWTPPDIWRNMSVPITHKILDAIEAGLPNGDRYSDSPAAKDRAAWRLIVEHVPSKTEGQAGQIITRWLKSGLLVRQDYTNRQRHNAKGLFVDNSRRPV